MKPSWLVSLVVAVLFVPATAVAAPSHFDAQNFTPAATTGGYFTVDSPFVLGHLGGAASLYLSYAHDPLVLRDPSGHIAPGGEIIGNQLGMMAVGSLSLFRRAEIALTVPFTPYQSTDSALTSGKVANVSFGDIRLDAKVNILAMRWSGERAFGTSIMAGIVIPSGNSAAFAGDHGIGVRIRLLAGYRAPRGDVGLIVGFLLRGSSTFYDLVETNQLQLGLGGRVNIWRGLAAIGEVTAAFPVSSNSGAKAAQIPVEFLVGLKYKLDFGLGFLVGAGAGLGRGAGAPQDRVVFAISYENLGRLTQLRESKPSNERTRRPPPPDDRPITPDPITPPPIVHPEVTDSDGDGIVDSRDNCPMQKGSMENHGCPDLDSDGDGLYDREDKCPFDPENYNGVDDDDGCDDGGGSLVTMPANANSDTLELAQPINFESGTLIDAKSFKVLDALGAFLRNHRDLNKVRIEGHTDNRGGTIENLDLSRDRAVTVRKFLVENHRIDGRRLVAQGFGSDKPIADNKTPAGRAKNRRIDIVIVERAQ